jgi:hypothetical protein
VAAGVAVVLLALGVGLLITRGASGSSSPGAAGPTTSATGTGDATAVPTTEDTAGASSTPDATGSTGTPGTSSTGVGSPSPSATHVHTPLPTYPASGRMVPPTLVSVRPAGCTAQTGGGWLAEFAVNLSGGSSWSVLPERGPVHGAQGDWTVGVETKDAAASGVTLTAVQVGGGTPFTSAHLSLPAGPVTAACPS